MTGTSFCCCCLSLRQVPQMMTSLIKSSFSWKGNTLIQASMACLVWSLVYSAAHLASICEVSLLVLKRFNITIVATFVCPLPKKYYRETDMAPLNLMWIIFNGFDHAGEAGWPNWRELHKQRKCPAGEETSYLPQLHTFSPLDFCNANTHKKK